MACSSTSKRLAFLVEVSGSNVRLPPFPPQIKPRSVCVHVVNVSKNVRNQDRMVEVTLYSIFTWKTNQFFRYQIRSLGFGFKSNLSYHRLPPSKFDFSMFLRIQYFQQNQWQILNLLRIVRYSTLIMSK